MTGRKGSRSSEQLLAVAALLTLVYATKSASTAAITDADTGPAQITNVCKEEFYLSELRKEIAAGITRRRRQRQDLLKLERKYRLAATMATQPNDRCLYSALAAKLEQKAESVQQQADKADDTATTAMGLIDEHVGKLKYAQKLLKTKAAVDATGYSRAGDSSNIYLELTRETIGNGRCTAIDSWGKFSSAHTAIDAAKLTEIKITPDTDLATKIFKDKITITGFNGCTASAVAKTRTFSSVLSTCTVSGSEAVTYARNSADYSYSTSTAAFYKNHDPDQGCEDATAAGEEGATADIKLRYAVCLAVKTIQTDGGKVPPLSGKALKGDKLVTNILRNCLPAYQAVSKPWDSVEAKDLNDFIESAYGADDGKFKEIFDTPLDSRQITVKLNDKSEDKALTALATASERNAATSHSGGQRNKKEIETSKKQPAGAPVASKESEEICKDKAQKECKEEDRCVFKEEKCKVKVTTTTGKDGKTNTTGSNSFVINKAPLLLAFSLALLNF
ncbi:variant surface glycoprotein (VSG), putative [Trypanosoma brucei brucei TREU927]|uniref:Variant surface glycoprotein (VSG), putative n=1 Tax=Trypanosoma brucei brucei (strain 927/4 GUTat10.1) TaxID=185431 RepID=Q580P2_TRYB2|nr:variant surface glycoprotein (VSG), putative [Trypanosoma brucei brucei TREU927]AAX79142.1 variant surface glycoprotein (VSG), putative [Trypanosoma brucei]AAZ11132.1 variant surface glycoprotein (VSG), putative [Trypanosoma brucei brucei TREU927]